MRKLLLHISPFFLQNVDTQIQRRTARQRCHQRPKFAAQLFLERLCQPFGQVVAVALQEFIFLHGIALRQPLLLAVVQGRAQKVALAMHGLGVGTPRLLVLPVGKAQDGHAPLLGTRAGR